MGKTMSEIKFKLESAKIEAEIKESEKKVKLSKLQKKFFEDTRDIGKIWVEALVWALKDDEFKIIPIEFLEEYVEMIFKE